jgi:hypothetical protein
MFIRNGFLEGDIKIIKSKMIKCDETEQKTTNYLKSAAQICIIEFIIKELNQNIIH